MKPEKIEKFLDNYRNTGYCCKTIVKAETLMFKRFRALSLALNDASDRGLERLP
jgi:hypothetical protein